MNRSLFLPAQRGLRAGARLSVCFFAAAFLPLTLISEVAAQAPDKDWVSVALQPLTPHLRAYAQVEPMSLLPVVAVQAGVVEGLHVLPGTSVRAGEMLAHLSGPSLRSLQLQSEADLRSATSQLSTAQESVEIQQQQLQAHLSTRDALHQAESSLNQAQTAVDNARSKLEAIKATAFLPAPVDGIVLALNSANGEWVNAGQTIVTIQPSRSLWARANFFGADLHAVHVGMKGRFQASDGSPSIPVKVASVFGAVTGGSGESVAVIPLHPQPLWLNGEAGTVTLDDPQRRLVAVPSRALIVHEGRWWVMLDTPKGAQPQVVVPGPSEGWNTYIESGLAPGAHVIVNNAYLLFHSRIAEQYQIPD